MSEHSYLSLLRRIKETGRRKDVYGNDGVFIKSIIGDALRFDMSDGSIPIMTTKKTRYRDAMTEMLWMISGNSDVAVLHRQGVTIWDEWAWKAHGMGMSFQDYQKALDDPEAIARVKLHYTNGTSYEVNGGQSLNQMDSVWQAFKKNPQRKSHLVNFWRPEDTYGMADICGRESVVLPACHVLHQLLLDRDRLTLVVFMRSWDMFLGAPFNIAQYGMLLRIYAHLIGIEPGELVFLGSDMHLYSNQFDQVEEMLSREPFPAPDFRITCPPKESIKDYVIDDFVVAEYHSHSAIKAEVVVVGGYDGNRNI